MFAQTQFKTLFAYHWHTNARLINNAAKLDGAAYAEKPAYSGRSIHELLLHLLNVGRVWRTGLETGQRPAPLRQEDYPDLKALQIGFEREQLAWQALLDRLTAEEIEANLILTSPRYGTVDIPRWRILQHVILHGMQHHTEIAQLLTAKGQSPGDIDFIFFDSA